MFVKFSEITYALEFHFIEAGANRFSTQISGKLPGGPVSLLNKNSTIDIALENWQKFWNSFFFETPMDVCFGKFNSLFLDYHWTPSDG